MKVEFNHLGVSVGDIDKAIEFYTTVLGAKKLMGPFPIKNDGGSTGITNTLYGGHGQTWTGFKLCQVVLANGVGLELMEFEGGYDPDNVTEFEFKKHGIFHFAVTVEDTKAFAEEVVKWGGEIYSDYAPRPWKGEDTLTVYVKDPFGLVYEVHDHSYEFLNTMPERA